METEQLEGAKALAVPMDTEEACAHDRGPELYIL